MEAEAAAAEGRPAPPPHQVKGVPKNIEGDAQVARALNAHQNVLSQLQRWSLGAARIATFRDPTKDTANDEVIASMLQEDMNEDERRAHADLRREHEAIASDEDMARRLQQEEYRLQGMMSSTRAHAASRDNARGGTSPASVRGSPNLARSPAVDTSQVELEGLSDAQVSASDCG